MCFDTPLWRRAIVVKHHKNLTMFILQGNFHKQLCDLASIGWLMKNTGHFEVITTIYGENTAKKILNGSDYERAVRCHCIITSALKQILLEDIFRCYFLVRHNSNINFSLHLYLIFIFHLTFGLY